MKKIIAALALGATFPVMASGVYVGGQLGWSKFQADFTDTSEKFKDNTFIGGAYVGYEFDMDQFFVAVEGDMNFGDAKAKMNTIEYKRGNLYGISGLIGMPVTQEFDIYGRVGWARTKFTVEGTSKATSNENGYSLGFGGRYHFAPQMAARLEYRYHGYSKFKFPGDNVDSENKEHMVTVGLQYMF